LAWFFATETRNDPNLPTVEIERYIEKLSPDYLNRQFKTIIYSRSRICAAAGQNVAPEQEVKKDIAPPVSQPAPTSRQVISDENVRPAVLPGPVAH